MVGDVAAIWGEEMVWRKGRVPSFIGLSDQVDLLTSKHFCGFDFLEGFDVSSIFQSKTGALEGPEVDGFVKDMMELVKVSSRLLLFINTLYVL